MNDDLLAWCSLWRAPGVGCKTFRGLLKIFGSPEGFFTASNGEVRRLLPRLAEEKWRRWREEPQAGAADMAWLAASPDHHILRCDGERFPPQLHGLADMPPLLFVKGEVETLWLPALAIVGSRNGSRAALERARDFGRVLASHGLAITSGLALGVDGAAHEGALAAEGLTIAVVGTGLDRVYPAAHRDLAHRIARQGALVSELPIGTTARSENFPRRNRLISALTQGVLVVEASLNSGSLITARLALEQGREVFAIPGAVNNPLARGCNKLIRDGAKLVETAADIWAELAPLVQRQLQNLPPLAAPAVPPRPAPGEALPAAAPTPGSPPPADPDAARLLELLGYEPTSFDQLVARTALAPEALAAQLSLLELEGRLTTLAGGFYQRL